VAQKGLQIRPNCC